jgi:hypothetical protein
VILRRTTINEIEQPMVALAIAMLQIGLTKVLRSSAPCPESC